MEHSANTTSASSVDHDNSSDEIEQPVGGVQSAVLLLVVGYFTVAAVAIGSLLALTGS